MYWLNSMDVGTVIAVMGLCVNLVVLIVAAVWVISSIKETTSQLNLTISHLSNTVRDLNVWLQEVDSQVVINRERLARIEAKIDDRWRGKG